MKENELRELAHLCRIHFDEGQFQPIADRIQNLLDYVKQIQELDTSSIIDYTHPFESWVERQNLLHDEPCTEQNEGGTYSRETFLSNVPDQIAGMVRVPNMQ